MKLIFNLLVLFLYFSKIRNQKCPLQETYEAVKLTRIFGLEGCRQIYSGKTCNSARMLIVLIKNKLDLNVNRDEEDESGQVPGTLCKEFFSCINGLSKKIRCSGATIFDINSKTCSASTSCADELLPNQAEFENAFTSTGFRTPTPLQYTSFSSQLNSRGNIDTKREAAMFLAHVLYESNGLRYKEEARCESEEGLKKCIQDYALTGVGITGQSYHGRGYIPLTFDSSYNEASNDLFNDNRLIRDPRQVVTNENTNWATGLWFWKKTVGIISGVKDGSFGSSTRQFYDEKLCVEKVLEREARRRFAIYKDVLKAFNVNEEPKEDGCYDI